MKRILVLNYEFPPLGGGAGNATYYLLKEFSKDSSLNIHLVTSSAKTFRIEKFSQNITIHYLDIGKKGNLHHQSNLNLLTYSWKAYFYAKNLIKKDKFDLIHAFFGIPCGYIAMKLGLPYIVSLRGADVPGQNPKFKFVHFFLSGLILKVWRNAKFVVANSKVLKEIALRKSPKQKIEIIYNGVDIDEFKPLVKKTRSQKLRIISTGRLSEIKGYNHLIDAIAGMNNVELTLVGDGKIRERLESQANQKKSDVIFLGRKEHSEIVNLLQNSDIYVSSSIQEGMSNSILEAMAVGLPIITTDTGGAIELIKENGFIVRNGSAEEIREAVLNYTKDANLINLHSNNSRIIADNLSWSKVAESYNNLY